MLEEAHTAVLDAARRVLHLVRTLGLDAPETRVAAWGVLIAIARYRKLRA